MYLNFPVLIKVALSSTDMPKIDANLSLQVVRKKSTHSARRSKTTPVKHATPARPKSVCTKERIESAPIQDYRARYGSYAAFWSKLTEAETTIPRNRPCDLRVMQLRRIVA